MIDVWRLRQIFIEDEPQQCGTINSLNTIHSSNVISLFNMFIFIRY